MRGVVDRKDQRPSTLLPNQYPPFDAVQRLYFQQIAGDGSRDPVVAAKGYFLETALVGLKFVYASGSKAQIGDTTDAPDHRVKVRFVKQGRVVGMLVGIRDNHIRYLKVLTVGLWVVKAQSANQQYSSTSIITGSHYPRTR